MSFVRSAYAFTPTAISNCALWLDGADPAGTGVVPAAGNLATWVDKSTSANNAIAGTAVYPQYNTAFLNNLGVVGLTNAADYFTVANNLNSASLTYVFVMKPTTSILKLSVNKYPKRVTSVITRVIAFNFCSYFILFVGHNSNI